jgi:hypothetical protein
VLTNKPLFPCNSLSPEDIQFFIEHSDFLKPIPIEPHYSDTQYYWLYKNSLPIDNINSEVFCDYLLHFRNLSNRTLTYLTKQLLAKNANMILAFPNNGFHILHKAMEKENYALVELLLQNGFDIDSLDSKNKTINMYSENNSTSVSFYHKMKSLYSKNISKEEQQNIFMKKIKWLKNIISKIEKNNKYDINEIVLFFTEQLPLHNTEEQEELIATILLCKNFTLLNKVLKLIGKNSNNYNPQHYPLWKNLGEAKHHDFFYYILNNKNLNLNIFTYCNEETNGVLTQISDYITNNHTSRIFKDINKDFFYSKDKTDHKIQLLISEKINSDFLFSINKNDYNNNWFSTICKYNLFYNISPYILKTDIQEPINNNNFQYILNQTWFGKDEQGNYNLLNAHSQHSSFLYDLPTLLSKNYIIHDMKEKLFNTEQKNILLTLILENYRISNNKLSSFTNVLIENLNSDTDFSWNNFIITETMENSTDDQVKSIIIDIKKIKLQILFEKKLNYKLDNTIQSQKLKL